MPEIATAFVSLLPSMKGFGKKVDAGLGKEMGGSKFKGLVGGAVAGTAALGGLVAGAVALESKFSKTMNVLQATTGTSAKGMEDLSDLALKMGADTTFSANDASKAMLELARGGMSAATIQGGALKGTLTLAAAGELDMGTAANIAVKSMGQFNLKGKEMGAVAAALAGGANASSASVGDMASALAQGGLAANSVGFSIQETTGVLAAFSNAGLEGSDAGTSLKTMLDRLQPTTTAAKAAMMSLGGWSSKTGSTFIKTNGEFKSAAQIAEILHKSTSKLGQAEQKRLITQAFGSDAQRAATIFAKEGAAGLGKMIEQTEDQAAAEKMAAATMKGTAGALEALSGSVETATLKLGLFLAPAIQGGLHLLTDVINNIPAAFGKVGDSLEPVGPFVEKLWASFDSGRGTLAAVESTFANIGATFTDAFGGSGGVSGAVASFEAFGASLASNVMPLARQAGEVFRGDILPAVEQLAETLIINLAPVLKSAANTFQTVVLPAVQALAGYLYAKLLPVFKQVWGIVSTQVIPILSNLATFFYGTLYPAVAKIVTAIGAKLKPVFDALVTNIQTQVLPMLSNVLTKFNEWLPTIKKVIVVVLKVVGAVLVLAAAILAKVLPPFIKFQGWLMGNLVGALTTVIGWIVKIIGWLVAFGIQFVEGAKQIAKFVTGLKEKFGDAVAYVRKIPGKIKSALGNLGSLLVDKGKNLVEGLWDGIKSMGNWLRDKLIEFVADKIPGPVAKALGINSPSRVMAEQAKWIPIGMAEGIDSQASKVEQAMLRVTSRVRVPNVGRADLSSLGREVAADAAPNASGSMFDFRGATIRAHDYDDFNRKMQRRARTAALGGVGV